MNLQYLKKRAIYKERIESIVGDYSENLSLRGSWRFDDFHLDVTENITYSDLDLIATNSDIGAEEFLEEIKEKVDRIIQMKISIHPADFFPGISLRDSKVKNIFEYLISFKSGFKEPNEESYMKAKILMLLMKKSENGQRFFQIRDEIGHSSIMNLYLIKLGWETMINLDELKEMIAIYGDELTVGFYENCILSHPSKNYVDQVRRQFFNSNSLDPWLKEHIFKKFQSIE